MPTHSSLLPSPDPTPKRAICAHKVSVIISNTNRQVRGRWGFPYFVLVLFFNTHHGLFPLERELSKYFGGGLSCLKKASPFCAVSLLRMAPSACSLLFFTHTSAPLSLPSSLSSLSLFSSAFFYLPLYFSPFVLLCLASCVYACACICVCICVCMTIQFGFLFYLLHQQNNFHPGSIKHRRETLGHEGRVS